MIPVTNLKNKKHIWTDYKLLKIKSITNWKQISKSGCLCLRVLSEPTNWFTPPRYNWNIVERGVKPDAKKKKIILSQIMLSTWKPMSCQINYFICKTHISRQSANLLGIYYPKFGICLKFVYMSTKKFEIPKE